VDEGGRIVNVTVRLRRSEHVTLCCFKWRPHFLFILDDFEQPTSKEVHALAVTDCGIPLAKGKEDVS
jgi:hypothetical protein